MAPVPRNVYGVTKTAAEDLCELVHRDHGLPVLVLRTSRFFPEGDDRDDVRAAYEDANLKVDELLYRRVDLEDGLQHFGDVDAIAGTVEERALIKAFEDAEANKKWVLGYFYSPQWFLSEVPLKKVALPPYTEGCDADAAKVACD